MYLILGLNNKLNSVSRSILEVTDKDKVLSVDFGEKHKVDGVKYINKDEYKNLTYKSNITHVISFIGKGNSSLSDIINSNLLINIEIIKHIISINKYIPILICNSIVSQKPYEGDPEYTASKFALNGWIQSMRFRNPDIKISQLHFQGIRFIGLDPVRECIKAWINYPFCNYDFIIDK